MVIESRLLIEPSLATMPLFPSFTRPFRVVTDYVDVLAFGFSLLVHYLPSHHEFGRGNRR